MTGFDSGGYQCGWECWSAIVWAGQNVFISTHSDPPKSPLTTQLIQH